MGVRLPSEYQEVEYLQTTGTQYILTNYIPVNGDSIDMQIALMRGGTTQSIYSAGAGTYQCIALYQDGILFCKYFQTGSAKKIDGLRIFNIWSKFSVDGTGLFTINNSQVQDSFGRDLDGDYKELSFFARRGSSATQFFTGLSKEIVVKNGSTEKLHLIQCYRKSDSKPGMYDLVTKQFFTNQGEGEFLVGPDVIDSISPLMVAWRHIMMAAASKNVEKWLGLSRVEVTVPERLTNAAQVYEFIVQHVPTDAWYWMACVEADFTVTPSTNNQFIIMCGIAGQTGAGSYLRFRDGAYNQNTSVSYNSTAYDLVLLPDTKISIFYNTGNDLTGGTVSIPNSSLSINVTRIQNEIENAAQLKSLLNGIHSGIILSVLNVDHADTSNYTANYNYMLSSLTSANSGAFMRWVNGNPNGQSLWTNSYGTVLHQNDVIVSIF